MRLKEYDMKPSNYVKEMNKALENSMFISALNLALIIPDVCATALDDNDRTSREKYMEWVDAHVMPLINDATNSDIKSEDIYLIRCSMLHNGSLALDTGKHSRYHNIRFQVYPFGSQLIIGRGCCGQLKGAIQEVPKEEHLTLNLTAYISIINQAVSKFLIEHPTCDRAIDKDRMLYSGISYDTDFDNLSHK